MKIDEDVLYLTVRELGDRIRTRQLSPVELTEAYLERCKKYGPQLNAFATLTARPGHAAGASGPKRKSQPVTTAGRYTAFPTPPRTCWR